MADLLIARGADIRYFSKGHLTALHIAAGVGDLRMVRYLVEHGLDVNDNRGRCGGLALTYAAMNNEIEVCEYLVQHGAKVDATSADEGTTPLFATAASGSLEGCRFLISKGADVNFTIRGRGGNTKGGRSVLMAPKERQYPDVVKLLIEHGARE